MRNLELTFIFKLSLCTPQGGSASKGYCLFRWVSAYPPSKFLWFFKKGN